MEFLVRVKKTAPARRRRDSRQDAGATLKNNEGPFFSTKRWKRMAGTTGLEPAASAVTGQRSNQLNYVPTR
jgi:hypothetical protein